MRVKKIVPILNFICGLLLSVFAFGGVGGVSGGPSAAKFIQVEVCGLSEDGSRCSMIQIRNRPDSDFGKGLITDCIQRNGDIEEMVPCSEEAKTAVPEFLKKLWDKDRKPFINNGELGEW